MGNKNTIKATEDQFAYVVLVPQIRKDNGKLCGEGAMKYRPAVVYSTHRSPRAALRSLNEANANYDGRADIALSRVA